MIPIFIVMILFSLLSCAPFYAKDLHTASNIFLREGLSERDSISFGTGGEM